MTPSHLPEVAVYIATSLDGYIAREDGGLDWLPPIGAGEDYGYQAFMASVDTLVMGRHTFEKVLSMGWWPYAGKRIVVLSSTSPAVPEERKSSVEVLSMEPAHLLHHLSASGTRKIYIDGGRTIQRFLQAGLISEMIITTVPVLIGSGIRLFGALDEDVALEHVETTVYGDGLVQSRYRVLGRT
jgi:dihydrofolate reductase